MRLFKCWSLLKVQSRNKKLRSGVQTGPEAAEWTGHLCPLSVSCACVHTFSFSTVWPQAPSLPWCFAALVLLVLRNERLVWSRSVGHAADRLCVYVTALTECEQASSSSSSLCITRAELLLFITAGFYIRGEEEELIQSFWWKQLWKPFLLPPCSL